MRNGFVLAAGVVFFGMVGLGCFGGEEDGGTVDGWPGWVTVLFAEGNATVSHNGNLSEGDAYNLDFASTSSMACVPATENLNFSGSHVIFATEQPPHSELTITVEPKTPGLDVSLYAYQIGTTFHYTPLDVTSAVTCEAGYDAQKDSNPGETESVKLTAINNPYNVVIGVAGPQGVTAGEFTLRLDLAL